MPRTQTTGLKGRTFGRLKVLGESERRSSNGSILWECRCSCKLRSIRYVTTSNLTSGNTVGCGCVQRECSRKSPTA